MSRSYKRTPVCKDGNASKKRGKKIANKKIRKTADLGQKSNLYKKGVNTDELVHTARSSSACFPVFQCTLSAA